MSRLPTVSVRDLSRRPAHVLERVAAGERLLVSRHGKPLATLQPLDGYVFQPLSGGVHDIFGWPLGGIQDEIGKLSTTQRALLRDCYREWRLRPMRLPAHLSLGWMDAVSDLTLRGLAKKTQYGWELTGRGLALHEALQREVG